MFIYLITNHVTGKVYVGQHRGNNLQKYLQQKFGQAKYELKRKGHGQGSYLFNSMRKHPYQKDWSIEPLAIVDGANPKFAKQILDSLETFCIDFLDTRNPEVGYNICRGGEGFTGPHSEETKEKVRKTWKRKFDEAPLLKEKLAHEARARLALPENQAKRVAAWQESLEEHSGSFHKPETADKIKEARAQQDEAHRLQKFNEFEQTHGAERRERAAATHRGKKHEMSAEGSTAISEAFKRGNARRWSAHTIIGQKFGRLTVQSKVGPNYRGLLQWKCVCDCGGMKIATTSLLRDEKVKSCGCLAKEQSAVNGRSGLNKLRQKQGNLQTL